MAASSCGVWLASCGCALSLRNGSNADSKRVSGGEFGWQRKRIVASLASTSCRVHNFCVWSSGNSSCRHEGGGIWEAGCVSLVGLEVLQWEKKFEKYGVECVEEHFNGSHLQTSRMRRRKRGGRVISSSSASRGVSTLEGNAETEILQDVNLEIPDSSGVADCRDASSTGSVTSEDVADSNLVLMELEGRENVNENEENKSLSMSRKNGMRWSMLLSTTALEDAHLSRASSVTDGHVLRRKGRLKEQDGLIEFIISMHSTHSPFQVMEKVERWIREHLEDPKRSTLGRLVPSIGRFYTPLPLVRALQEYDEFASLSRRRYVPPNFAEIRHVLNIAQVHAIAGQLSLITFDADGTLYADGHHIQRDNKMIYHIIKLMQQGAHVAIVTAAGYPGDAGRYEDRLAGLLAAFKDLELPPRITQLFHVMGGECNYLLRVNSNYRLEFVPDKLWKTLDMQEWSQKDVQNLLDEAEASLVAAAARLRMPIELIRKPRAVGAIPKEPTIYEVLEEMALTVQMQLIDAKLPFCAFNGGNDVFVDVGNKSVGLEALMKFLRKDPKETLHVGDRFTLSGNDSATRSKCSILWVANPEETGFFTRLLLREVQIGRLIPYIE